MSEFGIKILIGMDPDNFSEFYLPFLLLDPDPFVGLYLHSVSWILIILRNCISIPSPWFGLFFGIVYAFLCLDPDTIAELNLTQIKILIGMDSDHFAELYLHSFAWIWIILRNFICIRIILRNCICITSVGFSSFFESVSAFLLLYLDLRTQPFCCKRTLTHYKYFSRF